MSADSFSSNHEKCANNSLEMSYLRVIKGKQFLSMNQIGLNPEQSCKNDTKSRKVLFYLGTIPHTNLNQHCH